MATFSRGSRSITTTALDSSSGASSNMAWSHVSMAASSVIVSMVGLA